jgi:hypothetical protein
MNEIPSQAAEAPIITVGELKTELSRWQDNAAVTFRCPLQNRTETKDTPLASNRSTSLAKLDGTYGRNYVWILSWSWDPHEVRPISVPSELVRNAYASNTPRWKTNLLVVAPAPSTLGAQYLQLHSLNDLKARLKVTSLESWPNYTKRPPPECY